MADTTLPQLAPANATADNNDPMRALDLPGVPEPPRQEEVESLTWDAIETPLATAPQAPNVKVIPWRERFDVLRIENFMRLDEETIEQLARVLSKASQPIVNDADIHALHLVFGKVAKQAQLLNHIDQPDNLPRSLELAEYALAAGAILAHAHANLVKQIFDVMLSVITASILLQSQPMSQAAPGTTPLLGPKDRHLLAFLEAVAHFGVHVGQFADSHLDYMSAMESDAHRPMDKSANPVQRLTKAATSHVRFANSHAGRFRDISRQLALARAGKLCNVLLFFDMIQNGGEDPVAAEDDFRVRLALAVNNALWLQLFNTTNAEPSSDTAGIFSPEYVFAHPLIHLHHGSGLLNAREMLWSASKQTVETCWDDLVQRHAKQSDQLASLITPFFQSDLQQQHASNWFNLLQIQLEPLNKTTPLTAHAALLHTLFPPWTEYLTRNMIDRRHAELAIQCAMRNWQTHDPFIFTSVIEDFAHGIEELTPPPTIRLRPVTKSDNVADSLRILQFQQQTHSPVISHLPAVGSGALSDGVQLDPANTVEEFVDDLAKREEDENRHKGIGEVNEVLLEMRAEYCHNYWQVLKPLFEPPSPATPHPIRNHTALSEWLQAVSSHRRIHDVRQFLAYGQEHDRQQHEAMFPKMGRRTGVNKQMTFLRSEGIFTSSELLSTLIAPSNVPQLRPSQIPIGNTTGIDAYLNAQGKDATEMVAKLAAFRTTLHKDALAYIQDAIRQAGAEGVRVRNAEQWTFAGTNNIFSTILKEFMGAVNGPDLTANTLNTVESIRNLLDSKHLQDPSIVLSHVQMYDGQRLGTDDENYGLMFVLMTVLQLIIGYYMRLSVELYTERNINLWPYYDQAGNPLPAKFGKVLWMQMQFFDQNKITDRLEVGYSMSTLIRCLREVRLIRSEYHRRWAANAPFLRFKHALMYPEGAAIAHVMTTLGFGLVESFAAIGQDPSTLPVFETLKAREAPTDSATTVGQWINKVWPGSAPDILIEGGLLTRSMQALNGEFRKVVGADDPIQSNPIGFLIDYRQQFLRLGQALSAQENASIFGNSLRQEFTSAAEALPQGDVDLRILWTHTQALRTFCHTWTGRLRDIRSALVDVTNLQLPMGRIIYEEGVQMQRILRNAPTAPPTTTDQVPIVNAYNQLSAAFETRALELHQSTTGTNGAWSGLIRRGLAHLYRESGSGQSLWGLAGFGVAASLAMTGYNPGLPVGMVSTLMSTMPMWGTGITKGGQGLWWLLTQAARATPPGRAWLSTGPSAANPPPATIATSKIDTFWEKADGAPVDRLLDVMMPRGVSTRVLFVGEATRAALHRWVLPNAVSVAFGASIQLPGISSPITIPSAIGVTNAFSQQLLILIVLYLLATILSFSGLGGRAFQILDRFMNRTEANRSTVRAEQGSITTNQTITQL